MWTGKVTDELKALYREYKRKFDGALPDGYDELNYEYMSYENFISYMKKCIETGKEMPEVVL